MKHRFITLAFVLTSVVLSFSACQSAYEEEKAAVAAKIAETMGEVQGLKFNTFEQVGQTTVGQEVEMRTNAFKTKLEQDQKYYDM